MGLLEINRDIRRFHLDEEAIPESLAGNGRLTVQYANHGRNIVRNRAGIWLCAYVSDLGVAGSAFLCLAISNGPDCVGGEMNAPLLLVTRKVPVREILITDEHLVENVCLLMGRDDRLHVVYGTSDGLFRLAADAAGAAPYARLRAASAWGRPERLAEKGTVLGDAVLLSDGSLAVYGVRGKSLFQIVGGACTEVCPDAEHPSVCVDSTGTRHIAFERDRRIFYIASRDGQRWTDSRGNPSPELVAYFCSSWPSMAVTGGGRKLIAYQGEGKVDLGRQQNLYNEMRPKGGMTVSYAYHDGARWRHQDFLRSSEILLQRRASSSLPGGLGRETFRHHLEELWHPSLAVDKHGVAWMFFMNTTRRHLYFTRFTGERFGDHFEARGAYDVPTPVFFVQKDSCNQPAVGCMVQAGGQVYFDALPVPEYASAEARRVVFLDNLEVAEMSGVEHQLGQWQKMPEPLPFAETMYWCEVRRSGEGFEMRYMPQGKLYSNGMPGRAKSPDGLDWQIEAPLDLSTWTLDGKPFPHGFWRPIYLEDRAESDPNRRFKGLWGHYRWVNGLEMRTWDVVVSPDGLAWHTVPELEPVAVGDISVGFHLYCDEEDRDPRRRYKAMLLMGANAGRAGTLYTSPDLLHWSRTVWLREEPNEFASAVSPYSTGPIMLDPDGGECPWEEEIHDAILWRENGHLMMHYDAFYFHHNQHIHKALGISRDGRHFWRIKRGAVNLPHGACGEFDNGRVRTGPPVRVGDELWMYYVGMPAGCFAHPDQTVEEMLKNTAWRMPANAGELRPWQLGLAKLRVDGWGYLQRSREAARGSVTTIPFAYSGGNLVVNGSALDGVRVEIRTADDRSAVAGFEAAHCSFSAADGVNARVSWKGARALPPGVYRLRFVIEGIASKLYSFGFEKAAP